MPGRFAVIPMVLAAAGCATSGAPRSSGDVAVAVTSAAGSATMRNAAGDSIGYLRLESRTQGVQIMGHVRGLGAGDHGIHIHEAGRCDGDFSSAGAHFNPQHKQHGLQNPGGPHAGDMPNVTIGAGDSYVDVRAAFVTLDGTPGAGLLDADGSAIVIHAAPDDQRTDPAGGSGARVACGVVTRL